MGGRCATTAALLATSLAACAASARTTSCQPHGAHTLAVRGAVHVYSLNQVRRRFLRGPRVYACEADRRVRLSSGTERINAVAIAGRYVGFGAALTGIDSSSGVARVVDLASGHTIHEAPAASPLNRPEAFIGVAALVLDRHGHVAWIGSRGAVGLPAPTYEVRRIDSRGGALLDSGQAIDPGSLRLRGETVSWRDGGVARSAPL